MQAVAQSFSKAAAPRAAFAAAMNAAARAAFAAAGGWPGVARKDAVGVAEVHVVESAARASAIAAAEG